MNVKLSLSALLAVGAVNSANAVDYCGGYSSLGNPFVCGNGGNCTWWAASEAKNAWGVSWDKMPWGTASSGRDAMYWDDWARKNATALGYSVSTTPSAKTIGVKNSSPYKCGTKTCDYGHVAWIESVSNGQVTYTEMNYGYQGVNRKTKPASFFDAYISKNGSSVTPAASYDGKDPNTTGCAADATTVASQKDSRGNIVELRWSSKCKTNWARLRTTAADASASTTVTIKRSSDGRTYNYSGRGAIYSPMVVAPNVTACASATVNSYVLPQACR